MTLETVDFDTPANCATSMIVGGFVKCGAVVLGKLDVTASQPLS